MITRSKIASIVINFSSFNNSNVDFFGETHVDAILLGLQFTIQPIDLFQNEKLLVVLPWSLCSRDFPIP